MCSTWEYFVQNKTIQQTVIISTSVSNFPSNLAVIRLTKGSDDYTFNHDLHFAEILGRRKELKNGHIIYDSIQEFIISFNDGYYPASHCTNSSFK